MKFNLTKMQKFCSHQLLTVNALTVKPHSQLIMAYPRYNPTILKPIQRQQVVQKAQDPNEHNILRFIQILCVKSRNRLNIKFETLFLFGSHLKFSSRLQDKCVQKTCEADVAHAFVHPTEVPILVVSKSRKVVKNSTFSRFYVFCMKMVAQGGVLVKINL